MPEIQNLPHRIAALLREEILNNILKAGEPLRQQDLSKRFSVSMIPIREALRRLEAEGLVVVYPNRGAFVSPLSVEHITEVFETRIILETGAVDLLLPLISESLLKKADQLLDSLDETKETRMLSRLNQEFHTLLFSPLRNRVFSDILDSLHGNIERYMRLYLSEEIHHEISQQYHRAILSAIREKDSAKTKQLLKDHMQKALNDLTRSMEIAG